MNMNTSEGATYVFGKYARTWWRDQLDGYTAFVLSVSDTVKERDPKWGTIICVGNIPEYKKGVPLCLTGTWENDERGLRFHVIRCEEEAEDDYAAIEYLGSGICPGVGQSIAKAIVKKYGGKDVFRVMAQPDGPSAVIAAFPFLSKKTAESLCNIVSATRQQRELFEYISRYGAKWNSAQKLYKEYGPKAKEELKANPFTGMDYGMSFEQCDTMNRDNGFNAADKRRILSAAVFSMDRIISQGNEYTTLENLIQVTGKLLDKTVYKNGKVPATSISAVIETAPELFVEKGLYNKVWSRRLKDAEEITAQQIGRLAKTALPTLYKEDLPDKIEEMVGMSYAPQQKAAFRLLEKTGVKVLTGGPGTGKTTTVKGLLTAFEIMYPEAVIKLCAPTGRAAQRMAESTEMEAVTLHRLLEYKPFGSQISCKNVSDPIQADLIVIDESSMLDIEIASLFFSAVKDGTLVILIGDIDQLPSVGAGDVLHDLIASERVPVCRLTEIYRQSGQSPIVKNANLINYGEDELETGEDFTIQFCETEQKMMPEIIKNIKQLYDPENPFKTQVLVPTKKGDAGVRKINMELQKLLNPKKEGDKELCFSRCNYRIGDKIIMMSNNYEAGYFNGDLGIVSDINSEGLVVKIMDKEITLTGDLMNDVALAYAMTIHKSQGSEFENVIISLPFNPPTMLKRNLLYTAVTRAKKRVRIVAENGSIKKSVDSCDTGKRKTELKYRLQSSLRKEESV